MSTLTTEQPETSPSVDTDCSALLPDSMRETAKHIRRVQQLLNDVVTRLIDRAMRHDTTKLHEPEASTFAVMTAKLKGCTYGSEEYKGFLAAMKPALDHHYAHNTHHPEHWRGGIKDMSLLDLIEMLVDWKAAGERHADGSIAKSLDHNKGRFGYGDELDAILRRTAAELWPAWREPWHCFACGCSDCDGNFCVMCGAGRHDFDAPKT